MPIYKQWEIAYAFLNEDQLKDPVSLLLGAVNENSCYQDRQFLFDFFYTAIGSSVFQEYPDEDIRVYIHFFMRLVWMLEAAHRIDELHNKKQLHYSYSGNVNPD